MNNTKAKIIEFPRVELKKNTSGAAKLRKILDVLLTDYPNGVKLSTLRKISEQLMNMKMHNAYIVSNLMGHAYYIDCKTNSIFKG